MRILCLNQFYWPDVAPTSQLLSDLTRELTAKGHSVTVICGTSEYGDRNDCTPAPNVRLVRLRVPKFSRGSFGRLLTYATFFLGALFRALREPSPDLVISMTTPPLISVIGSILKKMSNTRHIIWEMDLYPEIAIDLGYIKEQSLIARLIGSLADSQRCFADGIVVLGDCMKKRLSARGVAASKIQIAENWADGRLFYPKPKRTNGVLTLIYPGNFGLGHDYQTLVDALPVLNDSGRILLRFIGGGKRFDALKQICMKRGWELVSFAPYCTPQELAENEFSKFDIGLILQDARCSGSIVPSKLYPLLASGLPVLFVGPKSATPALTIQRFGCGWVIEPGDSEGLIRLLKELAQDRHAVQFRGELARLAHRAHFDRPVALARLIGAMGI